MLTHHLCCTPLQNLKREGKVQTMLALPAPGDDGEVSERALVLAGGEEEEEEEVAELEEALADTELAPLTKAMKGKGLEQVGRCCWGAAGLLACWAAGLL